MLTRAHELPGPDALGAKSQLIRAGGAVPQYALQLGIRDLRGTAHTARTSGAPPAGDGRRGRGGRCGQTCMREEGQAPRVHLWEGQHPATAQPSPAPRPSPHHHAAVAGHGNKYRLHEPACRWAGVSKLQGSRAVWLALPWHPTGPRGPGGTACDAPTWCQSPHLLPMAWHVPAAAPRPAGTHGTRPWRLCAASQPLLDSPGPRGSHLQGSASVHACCGSLPAVAGAGGFQTVNAGWFDRVLPGGVQLKTGPG